MLQTLANFNIFVYYGFYAPVVQWIEQVRPKDKMRVRFVPGARWMNICIQCCIQMRLYVNFARLCANM